MKSERNVEELRDFWGKWKISLEIVLLRLIWITPGAFLSNGFVSDTHEFRDVFPLGTDTACLDIRNGNIWQFLYGYPQVIAWMNVHLCMIYIFILSRACCTQSRISITTKCSLDLSPDFSSVLHNELLCNHILFIFLFFLQMT